MPKVKINSSAAVQVYGSSTAVGQNTLSTTDVSLAMTSKGPVTKIKGVLTSVASASSPEGDVAYATVQNGLALSGVDVVHMKTRTATGSSEFWSFEASTTKFFAISNPGKRDSLGAVTTQVTQTQVLESQPDLLSGNAATAKVDGVVTAPDTLMDVGVDAIAVEDQLSSVTVTVLGAASDPWL